MIQRRGGLGPDVDQDRRRYLGYSTVGYVQATGDGVEGFAVNDRVMAWGHHGSHWLAKPDPELGHLRNIQRIEFDLSRPHKYWPWTQQGDRSAILRLIASGELNVDHLVSHVTKPEEAEEIYRMIASGTSGWMSVFFDWE
jgi:threonine dehydrogenase-like Zn-dependent dehydrogenase